MKDEALKLIERGFRVVPCNGKVPSISNWTKYPIYSKENLDKRWLSQYDNGNIMIATGNGIVVIDCDIKPCKNINGLDSFNTFLKSLDIELPTTLSVTTGGGGKHYYFRTNNNIRNRVNFLELEGVDIRATGGGVVAPPSLHESGNHYVWDNNCKIAMLPKELEDILVNYDEYKKKYTKKDTKTTSKESKSKGKKTKTGSFKASYRATEIIYEGERNDTLFTLGSLLKDIGLCDESIWDTLCNENKMKCEPPLEDEEIESICSSIDKFSSEDYKTTKISKLYNGTIGTTAQAIYYYLWWRTLSLKNNTVYVSQKDIATVIGVKSTLVVRKAVEELCNNDLIYKEPTNNVNGGYGVYSYTIL